MGILRSDRVSGLGGANAIKGSVEMRGAQNLRAEIVNGNADFNLGSSDFTIECWYNPGGTTGTSNDLDVDLLMLWNNTNNRRSFGLYRDSSGSLGLIGSSDGTNSDMQSYHSYNFPDVNAWYHIAGVRISNTATVYVNGTSIGSATVSGSFYENTVDNLVIGGQLAGTSYDSKIARGFISNMRLIIGDGIYTGAFTPPANELTATSNTKLLCCQSPANILQEATGKTLIAHRSSANDSFAKASTFVPEDKGKDYGTTFADNTKFDTLSYMVPPGGRTRDRYLKSTGDIVSGNLVWHIDAGNTTSYAGVTTSGTTIYDLQGGTGVSAVGIATLASGHSTYPAPVWTPNNGGAWYLGSDSDLASPSNVGQEIIMPQYSLGNDNYTVNVWIKLKAHSQQADGLSYVISNNDSSPVSYHAHVKEVSGKGRVGAGAYYGGWNYDYAKDILDNTVIALNQWYMLTWVNTAQYTQSMYVNGVIQKLNGGAYTWNSRSSNNSPVNSTSYANNETTNAWIGQIQYYSDTLTADEILQNYNAHKCRYDQ